MPEMNDNIKFVILWFSLLLADSFIITVLWGRQILLSAIVGGLITFLLFIIRQMRSHD